MSNAFLSGVLSGVCSLAMRRSFGGGGCFDMVDETKNNKRQVATGPAKMHK